MVFAASGLGRGVGSRGSNDGGYMAFSAMISEIWEILGEYPVAVLAFALVQVACAIIALLIL
jgi:hypothetical protein